MPVDPTTMSLPAAKELRARADRVIAGAALRGTPRSRFLRDQDRRMIARLLPTFAIVAVATGAAPLIDLLRAAEVPPAVSLTQGITATVLACLVFACTRARKNHAALVTLACAGICVTIIGWAIVTWATGGKTSPYALSVPLGLTVLLLAVPLLPWHAPVLSAVGAGALWVAARGAPPSMFVIFALLGVGGYVIAETRRARALSAFRRVERLAAAVARVRRVQDQLVVVEKLEALRVLVGGMAHELNNALAVSIASTEQIVRVAERDPAAAAKAAERAQRGLVRIRGTIDRLKRFTLAEGGVLEPADLCAMLDFALESAIGRARSGIIIDRVYEDELPPIDTHVAGLAEALFQIARNAVESMPKGGTIRASVRRERDRVVLTVADEGQGIPQTRLAKVFDPFYAREATDPTFSGGKLLPQLPGRSGLGLSAVYGIVSAIGGKVDIRSKVGEGTEVSLSLPAKPIDRTSTVPPPARSSRPA